MSEPRPFRIDVPDAELADLKDRLARTRWAVRPAEDGHDYGTPQAEIRELAEYWRDGYDWRAWEARLNAHPQFVTTIDGTTVHFLHVRSPEPDAVPLVVSHGWPGSVAEYLDVIGPLTDPRRHGLDPSLAFDLVIPSLPGSGWSGPTPDAGWGPRRIARAWAELMRRLGYRRYGAVGNDWGGHVAPELGRLAPDAVLGVHVTQMWSKPAGEKPWYPPSTEPADLADWSPDEREALAGLRLFQRTMASYHHVHSEQPETLGFALADSPVGLLAWNSQVMGGLDPDAILTHVSIHWLSGTAASALRIYADAEREPAPDGPTTVPLGLAQFPHDTAGIRRLADRDHAAIVSWHSYDRGGHYAAHQQPELLVGDVRGFFETLRARG
jgi:epoxide hydrolase